MSRFELLSTAALVLGSLFGVGGCGHREPPTPDGSPFLAEPPSFRGVGSGLDGVPVASPMAAVATSGQRLAPTSAPGPSAGTPPLALDLGGSLAAPAPPSTDATSDAALLPQTRDRPAAGGPAFDARVAALWDAVVRDDPDRAMPFFFPLGAYQQVKDVGDPAADWRHRLVAAYRRDIHALHARVAPDDAAASQAKLLGLELSDSRARWIEPGEEWNKIGYFRVFGSRLRYRDRSGEHAFDVKSLISWRGEWFVVHLSAI